MLRSFFTILAFFFLISSAQAVGLWGEECDPQCQAYRKAYPHGLVPYDKPKICIDFEQRQAGFAVFGAFDARGRKLNEENENHSNWKEAVDSFCVGEHWLRKVVASGGWIEICNIETGRILELPRVAEILRLGGMPPGHRVHVWR